MCLPFKHRSDETSPSCSRHRYEKAGYFRNTDVQAKYFTVSGRAHASFGDRLPGHRPEVSVISTSSTASKFPEAYSLPLDIAQEMRQKIQLSAEAMLLEEIAPLRPRR
jgi:hypothetical protein